MRPLFFFPVHFIYGQAMIMNNKDKTLKLKVVVSGFAGVGLIVHIVFPGLAIDAISLSLFVLALLPWLAPLIKAAELPGGFKIEFKDVQEAAESVAAGAPEVALIEPMPIPEPSYLAIADQDPGLALAGLRIEIEKRLRALAERAGISRSRPLTQLTEDLRERGILSVRSVGGLRELIKLGNQAAHGVEVAPDAASSAVQFGPRVLRVLDSKLANLGG